MTVAGLLTTQDEFVNYHGGSGSYRPTAVDIALGLAEGKVAGWIDSALVPTTITEEQSWPIDDGKLQLGKRRLISITSIVGLHSLDCSCVWREVTDCAVIFDARLAIIKVINCQGVGNTCWPCRCPRRVRVTYTYGFTADEAASSTVIGNTIRASVFTAALGFLRSTIGLDTQGNQAINSWSSVGYSESRQFNERSGAEEIVDPLIQMAKEITRDLVVKTSPNMRNRNGVGY